MWKCDNCGHSTNTDDAYVCTSCGLPREGPLTLLSEETGQKKTLKLKLDLGRKLLKSCLL